MVEIKPTHESCRYDRCASWLVAEDPTLSKWVGGWDEIRPVSRTVTSGGSRRCRAVAVLMPVAMPSRGIGLFANLIEHLSKKPCGVLVWLPSLKPTAVTERYVTVLFRPQMRPLTQPLKSAAAAFASLGMILDQ